MSCNFKDNYGFSLIEFMVSISIVLILLTVVVSSQSTYTDGIALSNLADEISSTVSQAQAYGSAVREVSAGSSNFSAAYGLSFSISSNKAYIYFADLDGDKTYDSGESISQTDISRGNYISYICAVGSSGSEDCGIERVDVAFTRPKTEPQLTFSEYIENPIGARIKLKSPGGKERLVTVYSTGQITVQ